MLKNSFSEDDFFLKNSTRSESESLSDASLLQNKINKDKLP